MQDIGQDSQSLDEDANLRPLEYEPGVPATTPGHSVKCALSLEQFVFYYFFHNGTEFS
jgi:hypothetical protein